LAKVAVQCSADTFVVNQNLVLRINICGENRHLRQARNRCAPLMRQFAIHIEPRILSNILHVVFNNLPKDYLSAFNKFLNEKSKAYFRESLISGWIQIPVGKGVIFKDIKDTIRFINIYFDTTKGEASEIRVYLNSSGIIGIYVKEDLENLIPERIDTSRYSIETVPISKYLHGYTDIEHLEGFEQIDNFLDSKTSCEVYLIEESLYYSLITLSDRKCIAFNDTNSIFLVDKISGFRKMISKNPIDFCKVFLSNDFAWIFNDE